MNRTLIALALAGTMLGGVALASSHREGYTITKYPKMDNTDLYMFRSYELGRGGYITILANVYPNQDPFGGPMFYQLEEAAVYDIHVDNNGDAQPDVTFEIRVSNEYKNLTVPVNGVPVKVPVANIGSFREGDNSALNLLEYYQVTVKTPAGSVKAKNPFSPSTFYPKPFDNIGSKSIPNYQQYSDGHISILSYAGCNGSGKVFVGQRKESFSLAAGEAFDLINLNPVGAPNSERNDFYDKNITTIAIEVPIYCLLARSPDPDPVIGVWAGVHSPTADGTAGVGLSRLGMPLVNELIIGLSDKDKFNASRPADDAQFATYVTNPVLPELIEILFPGVQAPNKFPRTDLVAAFLTGIAGLNQPRSVTPAEMLRMNTLVGPKSAAAQSNLGVLGGDTSGFPNGRRPGDDVVDITLRVAMGVLLTDAEAPSRNLPYTDGSPISALDFRSTFPYLNTAIAGDVDI